MATKGGNKFFFGFVMNLVRAGDGHSLGKNGAALKKLPKINKGCNRKVFHIVV